MKTLIKSGLFLAITILSLSACSKEDPEGTIKVAYTAKIDNGNLEFDQNYIVNNDTVVFKLIKFYVSNFSVEDKDGNETILLNDVHLIDFKKEETTTQEFKVDATTYKNPSFIVGLTNEVNESDPSSFSSDHPLSLQQGNYWMMADSYIYFKIEGFRKVNGMDEPFVYHVGLNDMGTEVLTQKAFSVNEGNTVNINVSLDFNTLFATVDFNTESTTHTTDDKPLADKMMVNFVNALTVN